MTTDTTRRAMLGATAAALAGGTVLNAAAIIAAKADDLAKSAKSNDPIFAAIERHRAAAQSLALLDAADDLRHDDPGLIGAMQAATDALSKLLRTSPTSLAGCVAVLRYIGDRALDDQSTLFNEWQDELSGPGGFFPEMIADAIERLGVS